MVSPVSNSCAKALMENYDEIVDVVPHGVQRIKGVERTNTLFTFSAFK